MDLGPPVELPWDVWLELQGLLEQSPDHLAAQAERLVAEGDPVALHAFVRDRFAVLPAGLDATIGARKVRWGVHGALRAGAGTPRELAELLADLYRQAELTAEVVQGPMELSPEQITAVLSRPPQRPFAPPIEADRLADWRELLELTAEPSQGTVVDEGGGEAAALAERLLAALPEGDRVAGAEVGTRAGELPLVRLEIDGEVLYANPLLPDAVFGDSYTSETPGPALEPKVPAELQVRVFGWSSADPEQRLTLVEGSWPFEELVGRRLVLQLVPAMPLAALVRARREQVRAFVPTLTLSGPGLDAARAQELSAVGDPVTLGGDRITVDAETGQLSVGGQLLSTVEGAGPTPQEVLQRVATLEARAQAARFPDVTLHLRALDEVGQPVLGLRADALQVEEQGLGRSFQLEQDQPPPARVLLVFDPSSSVPRAFRGDASGEVARRIMERVLAVVPHAELRAAALLMGLYSLCPWTQDAERVARAVANGDLAYSRLWAGLAEAANYHPTVVVLCSDGDASDADTVSRLRAVRDGPP